MSAEPGRAIIAVARQFAPEQHIYVAAENVGPERLQALLRLIPGASRTSPFSASWSIRRRAANGCSIPWTASSRFCPPRCPLARAGVSQGYGPTVLLVVLILVALGLTVLANRGLDDLTRMQVDFISHVSHQLKTPLSLLCAAMETGTMARARSPEKLAQYLGIMRGEVARLAAWVQRVLEYSRLQLHRDGFGLASRSSRSWCTRTAAA